eukprot:TRINITY_DN7278_c0_g2_i1.p2 TRINITY_DN7278_c0_g2~~TRINITY_DN7278_c0_g2_i1.p2  ORF type:complete len:264 (+),score=45.05 TRINITY_DN7278_c0_g2_i1:301-1092(+)
MNKHDTIGIDLVAMSVNDIVTSGAKPLFFLDYFATGQLDVDIAEEVVKGIMAGCQQSGCILLGGETAEMPGFYQKGEYDVAGFAVGSVLKSELVDGSNIHAGDVLVGFKSSGLHSNGFSLARKVLEISNTNLEDRTPWNVEKTFGQTMLEPTNIYVNQVLGMKSVGLKGAAHITGGGLLENILRVIPQGLGVQIQKQSWEIPQLFQWLGEKGNIQEEELFRTFNMGIGMVCVIDKEWLDVVQGMYQDSIVIGQVVEQSGIELQ